jgi:hypothetical protein
MSIPSRVVLHPAIQHPRVPSSTSLAEIRGRCHELLRTIMVIPACMPPFHTSQELGMVQYNEVIASLSLQISLRPSLAKTFKYTWSPTSYCTGRRLLFA